MRKLLFAGVIASLSSASLAAQTGIGLSVKSNDATIYVPIDLSKSWRIEPSINYTKVDQETGSQNSTTENLQIGAGVFGLSAPSEAVQLYYGARVSYLSVKLSATSTGPVPTSVSDEHEGYRIAPAFGFEYLFNAHFSLGGEVAWSFTDLDDVESNGTSSNVILRYKF